MFDRMGQVAYPAPMAASAEAMFEAALEAGADDVESGAEEHVVTCAPGGFQRRARRARAALRRAGVGAARLAAEDDGRRSTARPREALFKLLEALEDSDDVQNVYANFEVSDDVMARLSA